MTPYEKLKEVLQHEYDDAIKHNLAKYAPSLEAQEYYCNGYANAILMVAHNLGIELEEKEKEK